MRVCVYVCVRACACVRVCACACVCVCVCVLTRFTGPHRLDIECVGSLLADGGGHELAEVGVGFAVTAAQDLLVLALANGSRASQLPALQPVTAWIVHTAHTHTPQSL